MLSYLFLGIPVIGAAIVAYIFFYLLASLLAMILTGLWLAFRAARWAWNKAWLWSVDKRVSRAI